MSGDVALAMWAKSDRGEPGRWQPLIYHGIDAGVVARTLLDRAMGGAASARLAGGLGLAPQDLAAWVGFLTAAHDVGKAAPRFQVLWEPGMQRLVECGVDRPTAMVRSPTPHGTVTASVLAAWLGQRQGVPPVRAEVLARIVGGHHGAFPGGEAREVPRGDLGSDRWREARESLLAHWADAFGVAEAAPTRVDDGAAVRLAGLVSVADWVASDGRLFSYVGVVEERAPDWPDEAVRAGRAALAARALEVIGWPVRVRRTRRRGFAAVFGFQPRPGQVSVAKLAARFDRPMLVLIEEMTGSGKTESSFVCLERAIALVGQRGAYGALPTRATSDQMFRRMRGFLRSAFPDQRVDLQLVHASAAMSVDYEQLREVGALAVEPHQVAIDGESGGAVVAASWFAARKRGLLGGFAVGTIDQALLGVLQARHFFVRLWGLSDKVVILDEVHAYDAYMSELLERLVAWLGALDVTVVLMSATLPAARREALLQAFCAGAAGRASEPCASPVPNVVPYPRLTVCSAAETSVHALEAARTRRVEVELLPRSIPLLVERLGSLIARGACVAVVANTVRAARELYLGLKGIALGVAEDGHPRAELLTSQFRFFERDQRERRCLERFGPLGAGQRPIGSLLVATQVIEQSLDLDFDLLVSELAPIDFLIQRAGRLHRHERSRPEGVGEPSCWVLDPERDSDGVPQPDRGSIAVYDEHVLLRSWIVISDRRSISEPDDVEALIEAVYGDDLDDDAFSVALTAALRRTRSVLDKSLRESRLHARRRAIPPPHTPDGIVLRRQLELSDDDDPETARDLRAITREGPPSVQVVVLRPEEAQAARARARPTVDGARELLRFSVPVSDQRAYRALTSALSPPGWSESALLRHHKLLEVDEGGCGRCQEIDFRLDDELGLIIGHGS